MKRVKNKKYAPLKIRRVVPAKDSPVPKARSGHRIVTDRDGNIYSFGGFNPDSSNEHDPDWESKPLFKELWKFNISTKKWKKLNTTGDTPAQLASHCATLVNHNLIVYGGTGVPFGLNSSNSLHVCNLLDLKWKHIQVDGESPVPQYGQAIVYDEENNFLYVIGGTTGFSYSIDVHCFDFNRKTWTKLQTGNSGDNIPRERYRHEIVLHKGLILVFGGGTSNECFGFNEIPAFNLSRNCWESIATKYDSGSPSNNFPPGRRCHGIVKVDENIYIIGGTDGTIVFPDLWKLNLNTWKWTCILKKFVPLFFHSVSVSIYGQLMIFGGVVSKSGRCHSSNSRTNELYSVWLKVPPLKELAWRNCMNHLNRNTLKVNFEELLELGIPHQFASRAFDQFVDQRMEKPTQCVTI